VSRESFFFFVAGFVQQIVMKAAVHPYTDQMQLTDAFRYGTRAFLFSS
jgi:hypothetical protein